MGTSQFLAPRDKVRRIQSSGQLLTVLRIRIRIRIRRIRMFLGLLDPDPDPLVRGMDPDPLVRGMDPDPDPSIVKRK